MNELETRIFEKLDSLEALSLAEHQAKLIDEIGKKFIEQKGNIDKEITNLRGEIEKDISHIQSDLQLITNQKSTFLNQQRDSIVEFYSSYIHWLNIIKNFNPEDEIISQNIDVESQLYKQREKEAVMRLQMSSGKLDLYVQNDELYQLKKEVVRSTLRLKFNKDEWILQVKNIKASKEQHKSGRNHPSIKHHEFLAKNQTNKKELQTKMSAILSDMLK